MDTKEEKRITFSVNTPCSVSDVEQLLHRAAHSGHWHDAVVSCRPDGAIYVEYVEEVAT